MNSLKRCRSPSICPPTKPSASPACLDEALRLEVHEHGDPGQVDVERLERDHATVLGAVDAAPLDPLVGHLVDDLGVELAGHAGDRGDPVVAPVVELRDRVHAGHEVRERLELGPLVVRGAHRDGDLDGRFLGAHTFLLAVV